MAITVRIPQPLQKITNGQADVAAEGRTAGDLINNLEANYAGIRERLLDDKGKLRRFVNIYVNDEDIRFMKDLDTVVSDGDKVSIVPAIAGGVEPGAAENEKKKFYLTFPQAAVQRPVIWEMCREFDVIPNIRSASVSHEMGLLALEMEGARTEIDRVCEWLEGMNVLVEPVEKNVIE